MSLNARTRPTHSRCGGSDDTPTDLQNGKDLFGANNTNRDTHTQTKNERTNANPNTQNRKESKRHGKKKKTAQKQKTTKTRTTRIARTTTEGNGCWRLAVDEVTQLKPRRGLFVGGWVRFRVLSVGVGFRQLTKVEADRSGTHRMHHTLAVWQHVSFRSLQQLSVMSAFKVKNQLQHQLSQNYPIARATKHCIDSTRHDNKQTVVFQLTGTCPDLTTKH